MNSNKEFQINEQCEDQDQCPITDEELTLSGEGNQTIDEPPNLSSTPATPTNELEVEDTGATSTVVTDENEAESDDSDDFSSLPEAEVMRVGDHITQPLPTSNNIQNFKTNDPSPIRTTSASTATVADSVPASSIDNDFSNKEWVLGSNTLPKISNKGEWVVPGVLSTHEAASWEKDTPVEATGDQGGGLLVLPSTNWEVLRQMNDGENEIVVPPEKPLEPLEDSSDHSSDAN